MSYDNEYGFVRGHHHNSCNYEYRRCSRCNLPLKDPPSVERGVGPVCALQDTKLFATKIPANFGQITLYLELIEESTIPDISSPDFKNPRGEFVKMKKELVEIAQASLSKAISEGKNYQNIAGTALHGYAKTCDYLCSFRLGYETKTNLYKMVRALGYPSLAAVLSGEASTGPSKVAFDSTKGELTLVGSKTKAGYMAFKKIQHLGVTFPAKYNSDNTIRVAATLASRFQEIVTEFWPMFAEDMDQLVAEAKEWASKRVVAATPNKVVSATNSTFLAENEAEVIHRTEDSMIRTGKYNYRFYQAVSGLPRSSRQWDVKGKFWGVKTEHVANMIKELKDVGFKVTEIHSDESTPADFYKTR